KAGGKGGAALAPLTVGHAHRVLHKALARAVKNELLPRNVASVIKPPKPDDKEVETLKSDQITIVLKALDGHSLYTVATLALASGMRRGELLALRWGAVDLDNAKIEITHSLEQTRVGMKFKVPKTRNSRRTITLPKTAVDALRVQRRQQLEMR